MSVDPTNTKKTKSIGITGSLQNTVENIRCFNTQNYKTSKDNILSCWVRANIKGLGFRLGQAATELDLDKVFRRRRKFDNDAVCAVFMWVVSERRHR